MPRPLEARRRENRALGNKSKAANRTYGTGATDQGPNASGTDKSDTAAINPEH